MKVAAIVAVVVGSIAVAAVRNQPPAPEKIIPSPPVQAQTVMIVASGLTTLDSSAVAGTLPILPAACGKFSLAPIGPAWETIAPGQLQWSLILQGPYWWEVNLIDRADNFRLIASWRADSLPTGTPTIFRCGNPAIGNLIVTH